MKPPTKKKEQNKMKKLMIAAAIVCAAAMSQAATVQWKVNRVADSTKNVEGTYKVYFLMASDDTGAAAAKVWSVADATAAAKAKNADAFDAHTIPAAKTMAYDDGDPRVVNSTAADAYKDSWVSPNAENQKYGSFYAVIFNDTDVSKATEFMVVGPDSLAFGKADSTQSITLSGASSSWQATQDVPEPTSGLLLVLGLAGLALRRRRA